MYLEDYEDALRDSGACPVRQSRAPNLSRDGPYPSLSMCRKQANIPSYLYHNLRWLGIQTSGPPSEPQEMSPLPLGLVRFSVRNLLRCQTRATNSNGGTNLSGCSGLSWRCSVLRTVISKMVKIRRRSSTFAAAMKASAQSSNNV